MKAEIRVTEVGSTIDGDVLPGMRYDRFVVKDWGANVVDGEAAAGEQLPSTPVVRRLSFSELDSLPG